MIEDAEIDFTTDKEKFAEVLGHLANEIHDVCSAKKPDSFDNPIVLSFLSNVCPDLSYLPGNFFTSGVFDRVGRNYTGQTIIDDPSKSALILGEFLIIRIVGMNVLLATEDWVEEKGEVFDERAIQNFKMLGSAICHSFINAVNEKEMGKGKNRNGLWRNWTFPTENGFDVSVPDSFDIQFGEVLEKLDDEDEEEE